MRNKEFSQAIATTIELLQDSRDGLYNNRSAESIIVSLKSIVHQFEQTGQLDRSTLSLLFAPTGAIQEISIDNGWPDRFLELAAQVDQLPAQ